MPNYIGFSTINANKRRSINQPYGSAGGFGSVTNSLKTSKKFRLVDSDLVIRDLLNAFNISKGQKVGQPQYGTTLWEFIFEPQTADVQFAIQNEVRRVASNDPRLVLNTVKVFPQENGMLIEVEISVSPFNQAQLINIFFDSRVNRAAIQQG